MKIFNCILVTTFFLTSTCWANRHDIFKGEARENGKLVYIEKHDVTFDDKGNVLEAQTEYVSAEDKVVARLKSDFRPSLNLPDHVFEDLRTGNIYGIRRSNKKIILFQKDKGQEEKFKELDEKNGSDRLQVGCQGFNYYLKDKLDTVKSQKSVPVVFMIPGELTTYRFKLDYTKENPDNTVDFTVKIENWFLRAFAPELQFRYDKKINRIVWYKGISNIKNDAGKTMDVVIDYKYL